jgi:hypothetical protein
MPAHRSTRKLLASSTDHEATAAACERTLIALGEAFDLLEAACETDKGDKRELLGIEQDAVKGVIVAMPYQTDAGLHPKARIGMDFAISIPERRSAQPRQER